MKKKMKFPDRPNNPYHNPFNRKGDVNDIIIKRAVIVVNAPVVNAPVVDAPVVDAPVVDASADAPKKKAAKKTTAKDTDAE